MAQHLIMFLVDSELTADSTETLKNRVIELSLELGESFEAIVESHTVPLTEPEYSESEQDVIVDSIGTMQEAIQETKDELEDDDEPILGS